MGFLLKNSEFFSEFDWNIHVYDEAQHLKNITAKRTTAARKVRAGFKLCLTGTPLENHFGELYSIVDLAVPGALGTFQNFKKSVMMEQDEEKQAK
jgi:SNF2 family DNA or RNA helicase